MKKPEKEILSQRNNKRSCEVKETKINILVHKYELFKMEPTESITCMYTRFTDIVNNLKILVKYILTLICARKS